MSKNALVLEKAIPNASLTFGSELARDAPCSSEYLDLIRRYFQNRSAIAIVSVGSGQGAGSVCKNIAAQLAASGNRVVIVSVDALVRTKPVAAPEESACTAGKIPNVWLWPSETTGQVGFFTPPSTVDHPGGNWLDSLRAHFHSVLLDCPSTETAPGAAEVAAMADAAMLVVEAGWTTRKQIQRDQRTLQSQGVKLAGCILLRDR